MFFILILLLIPRASAAPIPSTLPKGMLLDTKYGTLTLLNNQGQNQWDITPSNATIYYDATGIELTQGFYHFTVNYFGNGTLYVELKGIPNPTITSTIGTFTYLASNGIEQVKYSPNNRVLTDDLCITYVGTCGNGGGSGGGGSGPNIPPAVAQFFGPNYFLYQLGIIIAVVAMLFILGLARNRRNRRTR